jgi:hypothetical protein
MTHSTKWIKKFKLGVVEGEAIYISPPSWDCGWYWGFGYLGNRHCHYHLDGLSAGKNQNLYDAMREHFGDSLTIPSEKLWEFCELAKTAYSLKETAEVLGRGGSHYSHNPCEELVKNPIETARINEVVLPAIFNAINDILEG